MTKIVSGLFGGNDAAEKEAARQRQLEQIAQLRQKQTAQDQSAETAAQLASSKRVRGRRLLFSEESGGLATTLGSAG